ncbi:MAG: class I SAM-dependent methyltransferase [Actinomycetota bacterium]
MTMKIYEMGRLLAEPVLPPLYKQVRARLRQIIKKHSAAPRILDVGGRKSPYTIGLPAQITVIDLPRSSEIQEQLHLGLNEQIINQVKQRRSNVEDVILGDITDSDLPGESFDMVVSVEVIEHVEADDRFVSEISRVLKRGGIFLLTTPNGDWVENKNPDHKRHYKKKELSTLLNKYFDEVIVEYAIAGGYYRKLGLRSWSLNHPIQTASSIFGNVVNSIQSSSGEIKHQAKGTHHLIAIAKKTK